MCNFARIHFICGHASFVREIDERCVVHDIQRNIAGCLQPQHIQEESFARPTIYHEDLPCSLSECRRAWESRRLGGYHMQDMILSMPAHNATFTLACNDYYNWRLHNQPRTSSGPVAELAAPRVNEWLRGGISSELLGEAIVHVHPYDLSAPLQDAAPLSNLSPQNWSPAMHNGPASLQPGLHHAQSPAFLPIASQFAPDRARITSPQMYEAAIPVDMIEQADNAPIHLPRTFFVPPVPPGTPQPSFDHFMENASLNMPRTPRLMPAQLAQGNGGTGGGQARSRGRDWTLYPDVHVGDKDFFDEFGMMDE